jgi:hypothetical protein
VRGDDDQQEAMFSYISPEKRVPADSSVAADPQDRGRDSERDVAAVSEPPSPIAVLNAGAYEPFGMTGLSNAGSALSSGADPRASETEVR